jgi:hypothetical protein
LVWAQQQRQQQQRRPEDVHALWQVPQASQQPGLQASASQSWPLQQQQQQQGAQLQHEKACAEVSEGESKNSETSEASSSLRHWPFSKHRLASGQAKAKVRKANAKVRRVLQTTAS